MAIKGITIPFEGDTKDLEKSIKNLNKDMTALDRELRTVNNALKFNPTSVELWRQKQQILTSKISDTEKKLELLKKQQKDMDARGVDKNSAEYRKLQREIVTTESKLKTFKGQLREVGNARLTAVSEGLKQIGSKAKEAGTNLTKYVTGPIVALGGASVKAFKSVDEGLDIVVAKTGATGDQLDSLKQSVKNLASEIPTDFNTAGTAVGEVATRFKLSGQDLEDLSGKFIKFAKLNNTDVTSSVDMTQKALSAFGLKSEDAGKLLDQLNVVGQQTGADMSTLLNGLIQNATGFQELGLSAEQAAVLMGQMETSGANSETVMQGLRKALKNAAADGVPLDQALANLQDTIVNGKDGMDGLTAAYDLFGKSGDQIYSAVKNGSLNFKDLQNTVADAGNSIDETFANTLDPTDQFQMAMNDLKTTGSELGSSILEVLAPAIEKISGFIQTITEKWNELSPGTQDMIVKVGLIAAAVGPLLVIFSTLINAVSTIVGAISSFGAVLGVLAGPVGIAVGIIAGLIAVGVLLYKNWDKIKAAAKALLVSISSAWTSIKQNITTTVTNIITSVTKAFNNLKTTVSNIFTAIRTTATNTWNSIKTAITRPIESAKEKVQGIISKIKSFFPISIGNILKNVKLPHFKWHTKDVLGKIKIPVFDGIDWFDKGGIFNKPSIIGVSEKRPEFVGALDDLRKIVREESGSWNIQINVYASPGMDVKELAAEVERRLINSTNRRRLAW